ncbi:leucine-rich repeat-containing protein 34-like isoform X1 [Poeciliopsis prolifica]|uniref:leucine-rich repeat-containing protein 34-like isoform X1 n=2 Tax=Poeciliopsis prolifica TaxID=188132 RepID=UPI002414000D|nr:leucine-rich repeat-containing protein 34-like isoform X1 [Poeciliopsis prolifica]
MTMAFLAKVIASETISECYKAICDNEGVTINPFVLENLERTTATRSFTLNLAGNRKQKGFPRLTDNDALALSKCLLNYPTLTGLDMGYHNISDEGAAYLAKLLEAQDMMLRSLDLTFNNIETNGAEVLASSLQGNSSLLSLRLSGNKIGRNGGLKLAGMLRVNMTLQELELGECDLEMHSMIDLSTALKNNTTLRSVDMSRALLFSLLEEWAVHFSKMLPVNSTLVELHLGKMGLTDTGMERLSEGLKLNHRLRYLDLRCNLVSRDGALHLSKVLKENCPLEVIDLSSNRIEDPGAEYLSEAICCEGSVLRELSVCRNNIGTRGLLSLAQALNDSSTLTHIYIWGNHLEEPVCQAFRELLSIGRLTPEQTDVRPYEVDGHVFLAELFHRLRKHLFFIDDNDQDAGSDPPQQQQSNTQ